MSQECSLSETSYREILKLCQTNKELAKQYIMHLYKKYMPHIENLDIERPLISIMNFVPLPFEFRTDYFKDIDTINKEGNVYKFMGIPGNRIMFGNRRIPSVFYDAVPFTIPITKFNKTRLVQSNIFYYEVELLKNQHRDSWDDECISIGYVTESTYYKNQVGWSKESWGFHSDDGCYLTNNKGYNYTQPWEKGDILGVGIKFLSSPKENKKYSVFLTKNGVIAGEEKIIEIQEHIFPAIGLDISYSIRVNFGENEFDFDLENYINANEIINNNHTFLLKNSPIDSYSFNVKNTIIPPNILKKINIINNGVQNSILNKVINLSSALTHFEKTLVDKGTTLKKTFYDSSTNTLHNFHYADNNVPVTDLSQHTFESIISFSQPFQSSYTPIFGATIFDFKNMNNTIGNNIYSNPIMPFMFQPIYTGNSGNYDSSYNNYVLSPILSTNNTSGYYSMPDTYNMSGYYSMSDNYNMSGYDDLSNNITLNSIIDSLNTDIESDEKMEEETLVNDEAISQDTEKYDTDYSDNSN